MQFLKGVRSPVRKLEFVPDQQEILAILENSRWIFHWKIFLPTQVDFYKGSRGSIDDFVLLHDANQLIAVNSDKRMHTWIWSTGEHVQNFLMRGFFWQFTDSLKVTRLTENLTIQVHGEDYLTHADSLLICGRSVIRVGAGASGREEIHGCLSPNDSHNYRLVEFNPIFKPNRSGFLCGNPGRLVQVGDTGTLCRWNEQHEFYDTCESGVGLVSQSPDGITLALATDDSLHLWDTSGSKFPRKTDFQPHPAVNAMTAMEFTPDGERLGIADANGCVSLLDAQTLEVLRVWDWEIGPLTSLAFSSDGMLAAAGGRDAIVVWDLE